MRYQIRCVCGHLSAFEIIPMPVVPGHRDMKISDEPNRNAAKQVRVENAEEMKFPETDPDTYKSWVKAARQVLILQELEKLLMFVRRHQICGLEVGKIRVVCFTPFGGPNLFNRKVWLFTNEIEAYNNGEVDEEALALEWKLSGLKRP